ncbi:hypothetical protein GCM10009535_00270 [Streptomyces thermocarboxydovorans]|uniref:Uncharacterized protein n=1 Tax=Streptomyces thermocarboxydovorans TaxID=59298 RepID=A0ABN1H4V6_9ACTN
MTTGLDTGTYELLRDRITAQAAELARPAEALNTRRVEEFGSQGLTLSGSAAQSEATRTEPPFRLQGSYLTMNRIAQRIRPAMDDSELATVVQDHYAAEAQTLTTGAEANLVKPAELRGTLTGAQAARWAEVKSAYGGGDRDGAPEAGRVA